MNKINIIKGNTLYSEECVSALYDSELGKKYFSNAESAEKAVQEGINSGTLYVAVNDKEEFQGFMYYITNGAFHSFPYLHLIVIKKCLRGKGIGSEMLDALEKITDSSKIFLSVADFNPDGKRFYEKHGYIQVGAVENLYRPGITEYLMMKSSFNIKIAETERLIIRRFRLTDKNDLCEYMMQRIDKKFECYSGFTPEKAEAEIEFRVRSDEFFAIELKSTGNVIGNIYLGKRDFGAKEIGYVLNENYHKKGYGSEAALAAVKYEFKNGTRRIYAEASPENEASWKLMEKIGLRREARLRKNISFHNDENGNPVYWDTYIYAALNTDGIV